MFDIGFQELLVILLVAVVVVGPKNLPKVARALGRATAEFRRAMAEVKEVVEEHETVREFREEYARAREGIRRFPLDASAETGEKPAQTEAGHGGEEPGR